MVQNKVSLVRADCLDWMRSQDPGTVDCIVTSPPCNLGVDYGSYEDTRPTQDYLEWLDRVFAELRRLLDSNGHFFLNVGYLNRDPWISSDVANAARKHFVLQSRILWVKSIAIGEETLGYFKPINSPRFMTPTNEDVFHFTTSQDAPIDRLGIGVPYEDKSNLNKRSRARGRIARTWGSRTGGTFRRKRATSNATHWPSNSISGWIGSGSSMLRQYLVHPVRHDSGSSWTTEQAPCDFSRGFRCKLHQARGPRPWSFDLRPVRRDRIDVGGCA